MGRCWTLLLVVVVLSAVAKAQDSLHAKCKDLLQCTIRSGCVQTSWLSDRFSNAPITAQLYDDLDRGIDYGCIFTTGCMDECNRCPLCANGKQQLVDVLTGEHKGAMEDCATLTNCATDCVAAAGANATHIQWCLRQSCALHCFDGSCPRCSAFITRVFNQVCVSGHFRVKVAGGYTGQCYELFRDIVAAKFASQLQGRTPAIG